MCGCTEKDTLITENARLKLKLEKERLRHEAEIQRLTELKRVSSACTTLGSVSIRGMLGGNLSPQAIEQLMNTFNGTRSQLQMSSSTISKLQAESQMFDELIDIANIAQVRGPACLLGDGTIKHPGTPLSLPPACKVDYETGTVQLADGRTLALADMEKKVGVPLSFEWGKCPYPMP